MTPRAWFYSLLFGVAFWLTVIVLALLICRFVLR